MSLVELMVSAVVFTTSASCSLQLWSSTSRWSQASERQLQAQQQLDQELLAVEATLQGWAGRPQAGDGLQADCPSVSKPLLTGGTLRPEALGGDSIEVTVTQVDAEGRLKVKASASGLSRERQLDPAAYGLCGVPDLPAPDREAQPGGQPEGQP